MSNVERYAFSVVWELTPTAEIVSTHFCKSIIKSRASLTYAMAQQRLDNPDGTDLARDIGDLNKLARCVFVKLCVRVLRCDTL